MKNYNNFICEGRVINLNDDNGNFIVLMGVPGGGKSLVSKNLINLKNFRIFDVDYEREKTAIKLGLDLNKPENNNKILNYTHSSTNPKNRTIKLLKSLLNSEQKILPNIVFDTVGTHIDLIKELISKAKEKGYVCTMVYVKCDLETALYRNQQRKRRLADEVVIDYHNRVQNTFDILFNEYDNVWMVDSNITLDSIERPNIIRKLK